LYQKEFYGKVQVVKGNCIDWWMNEESKSKYKDACVFADPPWGGSDYKDSELIQDLTLTDNSGKSYGMVAFSMMFLKDVSGLN
jgi:hypothetical protein